MEIWCFVLEDIKKICEAFELLSGNSTFSQPWCREFLFDKKELLLTNNNSLLGVMVEFPLLLSQVIASGSEKFIYISGS